MSKFNSFAHKGFLPSINNSKPNNATRMTYGINVKHGFTLIELLVVISIIGLLSSVITASLSTARMKARDAKRISDLGQIKLALEMYFDSKGYYPGTYRVNATYCPTPPCWDFGGITSSADATWDGLALELSPYIKNLPKDPINTAGCTGVSPSCYIYAYGRVGRFGINLASSSVQTVPNVYDLVTNLEDPNNPNACKFNDYRGYTGLSLIATQYCNPVSSNPGLYDISPN